MPGGSIPTDSSLTGEWTDPNDLLYLRARYYAPGTGVFTALDPFEGSASRPMSLNGYSWVEGNTPNRTDPTGLYNWQDFIAEQGDTISCIAQEGGVLELNRITGLRFFGICRSIERFNSYPLVTFG